MTIAVVAIGVVALPCTMSLFQGQHTWYDLSGAEEELPCKKCHADVFDELNESGHHMGFGSAGPDNDDCYACHRTNTSIGYANVSTKTPGEQAHAASTVACMICHQYDPSNATYTPKNTSGGFAGGFSSGVNSTSPYNYVNTNVDNPGGAAAHDKFINSTIQNMTNMEDANEACVACHTHVPVDINWTHAYSMQFNASYKEGIYPPTHFNVSNFNANGTYNTTVTNGTASYP